MQLICGDCLDVMKTLPDASVDAVITDPPYPCIKRSYGYWTEEQWFALMKPLVGEVRRVLKPKGSAVFVLQPNSERVGKMRTWLWEFMTWVGKEWGIVQDAYWWNHQAMPEAHSIQGKLMRPSLKTCVWSGLSDCYRNQDRVLQEPSDRMKTRIRRSEHEDISGRKEYPSGHGMDEARSAAAAKARGGVTPFNVLAMGHGYSQRSAGAYGHGAGTPVALCDWWTRYIVPPNGTVLDPFMGSGTTGIAALKRGHDYIGIERNADYIEIAQRRLLEVEASTPLFQDKGAG